MSPAAEEPLRGEDVQVVVLDQMGHPLPVGMCLVTGPIRNRRTRRRVSGFCHTIGGSVRFSLLHNGGRAPDRSTAALLGALPQVSSSGTSLRHRQMEALPVTWIVFAVPFCPQCVVGTQFPGSSRIKSPFS